MTDFVSVLDLSYGTAVHKESTDPYAGYRIMREVGVRGLIVRAGQGVWDDNRTQEHVQGAHMAGLDVLGIYFLQDDRWETPVGQVLRLVRILRNLGVTPKSIWWDLEHFSVTVERAKKALDTLDEVIPLEFPGIHIPIGVYSRASYLRPWGKVSWLNKYPYWGANYVTRFNNIRANLAFTESVKLFGQYPELPPSIDHCEGWQSTDKANGESFGMNVRSTPYEPGITLSADFNIFRKAFYEAVVGGTLPPPPVPIPPGPGNTWNDPVPDPAQGLIVYKIVSEALRVRADHSTSPGTTILEVINKNTTCPVYEWFKDEDYVWGRIGWKHWIALYCRDGRVFATKEVRHATKNSRRNSS